MGATNKLKEALAGPAKDKREPAVADGLLSVTPDPPEAAEWRNKSVLDTVAADSTLLEEESGKRPNELFGKFTWRIENFEIGNLGKRELRSTQFDVGEYKWYILVYPQGCDVCNHLSLFLCVADYDKLLPGWSHFAQFTIAVVNKDPKKSKYSDTLHRFCKKEHDWGWKKFMELSKVLDGFTVADTLVIKAQVQVILDRPSRPFRCLDAQYRRELVRVYLTNVESICRRFCEDRRQQLAWLREEGSSFGAWWRSLGAERRKQLTTEKGESILKGVVKQFFNEKEVTSTLVMDALYCGCRQLECLSRKKGYQLEGSAAPCVVINGKSLTFSFALDALEVVAQLSQDFLPPLPNDKVLPVGADGLGLRSGCDEMSELRRDALERDEKRLAELGRRTVEMYALGHIFTERLERAYRDHQAEKRMKDLIAEEEEAGRLEDERAAARAAADKEKRAKKNAKKKAKKEADKAKRDAEEAERTRQEQEKRAEIERRVLEANERRRQEELDAAAQMQQQHKKQRQQQQQDASAASARKQHPEANGTCSTAEAVSSSSSAPSSTQTDSMRQQQGKQQLALSGRASSDAEGPSASTSGSAAAALGTAGSWRGAAAGSKHSSSSSPAAPASLADDGSEVTSVSDLDDSSSMELGSSSKGFTPVVGRHAQHLQHQQAQQQQQAPLSARGQAAGRPPQQPPAAAAAPAASQQHSQAPGPSQQQQQQPGSIPTGYAAAVAGMRPPPPAEVVSAAAALAEQARRTRQLEEQQAHLESQVAGYQQQLEGLEAAVADRDTRLAEADAAAARKDQQLAQLEAALSQRDAVVAQKAAALARKDQELQELRDKMATQQQQVAQQQQQLVAQQQQLSELRALQAKTANELRAAQAVNAAANAAQAGRVSSSSSKDGGTGRRASAGLEDGAAGAGSSGRQRGQSVDLTSSADALASSSSVVAGPSTSAAPWAAIAAGTAAAAVGSSLRDSGTASPSGSQDLAAAAAAAAAANGPAAVPLHEQRSVPGSSSSSMSGADAGGGAHPGPLSYAEKVGAAAAAAQGAPHPQQLSNPGLHTSGASASRAAAAAGSTGSEPSSSSMGGVPGSSGRSSAGERLAGSRDRQGSAGSKAQLGPAAAGMSSAADEPGTPTAVRSGIGRTHSPQLTAVRGPGVSSLSLDGGTSPGQPNMHGSIGRGSGASRFTGTAAQQQQQQQQYGSGMPSSSNRGPDSHRGPERGPRNYLSNGIAGVLHSSVPSSSGSPGSSPSMHSYRNAAAAAAAGGGGAAAAGLGPSSVAAVGGGGGSGGSMRGMLGSAQGGAGGVASSSLDGGKVPGGEGLGPQQHPFAYAASMAGSSRAVPGFGPVAASNAKGSADASVAALRSASTSSMAMDDAGLDGFVHMHMIDDLLTE